MFSQLGMWVLLVASGAAFDVYDELAPTDLDGEVLYQGDYNVVDPGYFSDRVDPAQNLFMYKLMNYIADKEQSSLNRPRLPLPADHLATMPVIFGNELDHKLPMSKRTSETHNNAATGGDKGKPVEKQPKWKNKKGRTVGSPIICYFKLCGFRAPRIY